MAKKAKPQVKSKKDYLRLPFEVYYSGPISYASLELTADDFRPKKPKDIKGVHVEEGNAYGLSFYCANNAGGELLCCLTAGHEGTVPNWLKFMDLENVNMNHGYDTGVELTGNELSLNAPETDDADCLENTGIEKGIYRLTDEDADYIILDADGDRIKIDIYGCLMDDDRDDENDDSSESSQIIDVDSLAEMQDLSEYTTKSYEEAQDEWISEVWTEYFPKLPKVKISEYAY
jgi:hypothetical protein